MKTSKLKCEKCGNCQNHCECIIECRKCDLELLKKGTIPERFKVKTSLNSKHDDEDIHVEPPR